VAEEANGTTLEKTLKALLLIQMGAMKQKEQIALLDQAGFGQMEISRCVGSTPGAVSVRLAEIRRGRKAQDRKNK
jgi:hypothetical protein